MIWKYYWNAWINNIFFHFTLKLKRKKQSSKIPYIFLVDVWLHEFSLKIFVKPQLVTVVLKKIVKPWSDHGFQNIFKTAVTNCGFMVIMIKNILKNNIKIIIPLKQGRFKNIMKPQLLTRKIVKPHSVTVVLKIFLKLLKSQSVTVVFYTKKTRMNDYVDRKYYFDKYFEMTTILTIFFYQRIILDLSSILESWQTRWARRICKMVEREFLSFWWVTYWERKGSQWERHVAKF